MSGINDTHIYICCRFALNRACKLPINYFFQRNIIVIIRKMALRAHQKLIKCRMGSVALYYPLVHVMYYIKADLRWCLVCSIIWQLRNQSAITMNACVFVLSALVAVAYTAVTDEDVRWVAQRFVDTNPWSAGRNYQIIAFVQKNYPVIISVYFYLKL